MANRKESQAEPKEGQIAMHKGDKTLFVNDRHGACEHMVKHGWSVDKEEGNKTDGSKTSSGAAKTAKANS